MPEHVFVPAIHYAALDLVSFPATSPENLFHGKGEMAVRMRATDWAKTPLGPAEGWPQSLRTAVGIVLASAFPMIVLWGDDLVQLYNDGYRDLMGVKHPAGLGQPTRACWPEVWDFNAPIYAGVCGRGETFQFDDQLLVIARHGAQEEAYFTLSYSPILNESDEVGGVLVTVLETTERVMAARRLTAQNAERAEQARQLGAQRDVLDARTRALEAANEELEAFAYGVSHDLRTPVRHIAGFSDLLRKSLAGQLDERAARYLNVIDDAAERMNILIDAMLDLSRTARLPLRVGPVDLSALVAAVRADLELETLDRRLVWAIEPLPLVSGDRETLRQVVVNLLSNAVKYTRTREEARVALWAEERPEAWAVFVRDNGVGFDPRYGHKLFGVFQRLHREEAFEGVGVGLANVRRIVERHGGRTWAEGSVNGGATFAFTLPKADAR